MQTQSVTAARRPCGRECLGQVRGGAHAAWASRSTGSRNVSLESSGGAGGAGKVTQAPLFQSRMSGVPRSQSKLEQGGLVPNMTCVYVCFLNVPKLLPDIQVLFCCNSSPMQLYSKNNDAFGFLYFSAWIDPRLPSAVTGQGVLLPVVLVWQLPHILSPHSSSLCSPVDFIKIRECAEILQSFEKICFTGSGGFVKYFLVLCKI